MFGILYALYDGVMCGINKIDKNWQTSINREEARQNGELTYRGSQGNTYLVENGRQVIFSYTYDGHKVIKDYRTGKIYYDLTEEKKNKYIQKCKNKGLTVYEPQEEDWKRRQTWERKTGFRGLVIDIETNHFLGELLINEYRFYIDLTTGYLLRRTDSDINYLYKKKGIYDDCVLTPEEIISYFNRRQDVLRKNPMYNEIKWRQSVYYLSDYSGHLYMNKEGRFIKQKIKKKYYEEAKQKYGKMRNNYNKRIAWEKQNGYYMHDSIINKQAREGFKLCDSENLKEQPATTHIGFAIFDINA